MSENRIYKTLNISLQSKRYLIVQDIVNNWNDKVTKSEVVCEDILSMYKLKNIPCLEGLLDLINNRCEPLININDNDYFESLNNAVSNYFKDEYSNDYDSSNSPKMSEVNNYKKLLNLLIDYDPTLAIKLIKKLDT